MDPCACPVCGQWRVAGRGTGRRVSRPDPSDAYPERGSTMENETPLGSPPLCPSAQPQMEGSTIIGVVGGRPGARDSPISRSLIRSRNRFLPSPCRSYRLRFSAPERPARGMAASILTVLIADSPGGSSSCYPRRGWSARVSSPAGLPLVAAGGQGGLSPLPAGHDGREPSLRTLSTGCRSRYVDGPSVSWPVCRPNRSGPRVSRWPRQRGSA